MAIETTREEIAEAAGHLMAELLNAQDYLHRGVWNRDTYKKRVDVITKAAARFHQAAPLKTGVLVMVMEDIP